MISTPRRVLLPPPLLLPSLRQQQVPEDQKRPRAVVGPQRRQRHVVLKGGRAGPHSRRLQGGTGLALRVEALGNGLPQHPPPQLRVRLGSVFGVCGSSRWGRRRNRTQKAGGGGD